MLLSFLGRGSAFSDEHNSCFFSEGSDLVLIDHSFSAFLRLKNAGVNVMTGSGECRRIYVIVTHTHSDHIGGIPLLIHYAFYVLHIPVTVAVPSEEVGRHMHFCLDTIEGCEKSAYEIVRADSLKWVRKVIPTRHTPELAGRCFGYLLDIGGREAVYTGDTGTLEPFLPYIGAETELYSEAAAADSGVHLYINDAVGRLEELCKGGTKVYLMHLDDEDRISRAIAGTDIRLVPRWK